MTDPMKARVLVIPRDAPLVDRAAGYAALQVAVQRVAARKAGLTPPERPGSSR